LSGNTVSGSNGTQTVSIDFDPSVIGTHSATVTVTSQDWQDTVYTFVVSGDGFEEPTFATDEASAITSSSATLGGRVTKTGGNTITEQGIVYGTSTNPVTSGSKLVDGSTGVGSFSDTATGLTKNTMYYFRPYAIADTGTYYGDEKTFTTLAAFTLTVAGSGTGTGTITSDAGGINATWDGSALSGTTSATFDVGTNVQLTATPDGSSFFDSWSGGLSGNTNPDTITVNTETTVTGTFIENVEPSFTTTDASAITSTTSTIGANLTVAGNLNVSERGLVWGTSANPTTGGNKEKASGTGIGAFTADLTGLTENTTYYYRPYAVHDDGTTYGPEKSFTTQIAEYTVSGTIMLIDQPLAGVDVVLDGQTTTTDANGDFSFTVETGFSGTITPTSGSYRFTPASISVEDVTEDSPGNDFAASTSFNLSGYAFFRGAPLANVHLSIGGKTAMTNGNGYFVIEVDQDFSGTLTPSRDGFSFTPASVAIDPVQSNVINLNFTGRLNDKTAAWPGIRFFHSHNSPVDHLGMVELHWSVDNVDSVKISGVGDELQAEGTAEVEVRGPKTFVLTAENDLQKQTATVRVSGPKAPRILWFMGESEEISNGESTMLSYGTHHAQTTELTDNQGSDPIEITGTSGEISVNPDQTTIYTLKAENNGKMRSKKVTVEVSDAPIIDEFRADRIVILPGDEVTLRWKTSGADEVEINGIDQSLARNGDITLSQSETTTYQLIATNTDGSSSKELTVSVHEQSELADLQVELEVEELDTRPDAGDSVKITAIVTNNGAVKASNVELIFSSGGHEQFRLPIGDIAIGGSKTRRREIVLLGRGRVKVEARATTQSPEYDLTDNSDSETVQTKRVAGVDLAVSNPTVETTEVKGVYRFSFVIFNVGTSPRS
jgi:hypothetical protein